MQRWLLILALLVAACAQEDASTYDAYGEAFGHAGSIPVDAVLAEPALYVGESVKIEGTVHAVCQMMGCWLTLRSLEGGDIRVHVARTLQGEYAFTVPKDISGRRVIASGVLAAEAESAAAHNHYSEDAGGEASTAELQLTADGVLVAPL